METACSGDPLLAKLANLEQNSRGKCVAHAFVLDSYMVQQLVYVRLISQTFPQNFVLPSVTFKLSIRTWLSSYLQRKLIPWNGCCH